MPGAVRLCWITEFFKEHSSVSVELFNYDESILPNTSVSSEEVSMLWGDVLKAKFPHVTALFTSEKYGDYLAARMNITHFSFDVPRNIVPVSGSRIRQDPFKFWDYLPKSVRPFFVKKICLSGSESTGKSTLAKNLGIYFNTVWVPEMAREIIFQTKDCNFKDLHRIAESHARAIQRQLSEANMILICDTDLHTTKAYSKFLFNRELKVPSWIEDANSFDMYLFLESDCPFIQDGTRLSRPERDQLAFFHKRQLDEAGIQYISISGDWQTRFDRARELIVGRYFETENIKMPAA
jgi:HTH-type transcriptional repressor of NAD biosynthesis genes